LIREGSADVGGVIEVRETADNRESIVLAVETHPREFV